MPVAAPTLPTALARERADDGARHGLRAVLGAQSWLQLPEAVRERFADTTASVTYAGAFEVVRASPLGRVFAWLGKLAGSPVAPRVGSDVEARVMVRPEGPGVAWYREYRWADGGRDLVRSIKTITREFALIEKLPARLCMPLQTVLWPEACSISSASGTTSTLAGGLKLHLPAAFTPGVTHVEHIDLGHGWFRFTMTVTHPWLGETFFQTGRFCAAEGLP